MYDSTSATPGLRTSQLPPSNILGDSSSHTLLLFHTLLLSQLALPCQINIPPKPIPTICTLSLRIPALLFLKVVSTQKEAYARIIRFLLRRLKWYKLVEILVKRRRLTVAAMGGMRWAVAA